MVDIKLLKELIRLMTANELVELDIRDKDEQITLKRPGPAAAPTYVQAPPMVAAAPAPAPAPAAATGGGAPGGAAPADDTAGLIEIKSPMVGTFYSAPSPDADAFVRVGASIGPNTVVCVIEAMKVFNEIKAEVSGTVRKVLVNNGQVVDFNQTLFLVQPN